jgi:hypothetical protein
MLFLRTLCYLGSPPVHIRGLGIVATEVTEGMLHISTGRLGPGAWRLRP